MEILKAGAIVRRMAGKEVQVLLLHQLKHYYWALPKGHCEQGETFEETAKREVFEESGLNISIINKLGVLEYFDNNNNSVKLTIFLAEAESGELHAEDGCELV
jgi:ADP-ribose pyrophosphatase YjhB (NUDIX family)